MFKKILFLNVLLLSIIACKTDTENTMTVSGNIDGLKKGKLYLQKIADSTLVNIDSLEIKGDGNFVFSTALESPEIFYLYLNKKDNNDMNDRITFFGEPGVITINTKWNNFDTKSVIEGSEAHKKLEEYKEVISNFNKKNLELMRGAMSTDVPLDSLQLDSIQRINTRNVQREYAFALNFALNNTDSYIAPYIAVNEVSNANIKYLDSIYNALTPKVADSKYGKELKKLLESSKEVSR